jgi:hypothetical protein
MLGHLHVQFRLIAIALLLALSALALAAMAGWTAYPPTPASGIVGPLYSSPQVSGPIVGVPVRPVVWNGNLQDLQLIPFAGGREEEAQEPRLMPFFDLKLPPGTIDSAAQTWASIGLIPNPIIQFLGVSRPNNFCACLPPDTNGVVGTQYYVQTVNTAVGIFDKSTGVPVATVSEDAFFAPAGAPCNVNNDGDPVVLYDRPADRFVVTNFNNTGGPNHYEAIAVSQTGNPVTGGWYYYCLLASTVALNDYPKLGVWPDGYYMASNMFGDSSPNDDGVKVWALDRVSMLSGGTMNNVSFFMPATSGWGGLLPSNMDYGTPPAGAPNYFMSAGAPDQLGIWQFHVDWVNPNNSTFTGPTQVTVAPFQAAPGVPQQGTGALLDTIDFRLMQPLQYVNRAGIQSLWATHNIAYQGRAAVRWYEVQAPASPVVAQQGTYVPDNLYRWMGSLAVDRDGNMAIGYSVSSSTMYPAIRYAGRLLGEFPGALPQGEATLYAGAGSQTSASSRWGDYSGMALDPVDDCTFWYTTEYYAATSSSTWQTRIGSFKFPSCNQPKGTLTGRVTNAVTGGPVASAPVAATVSVTQTFTAMTDANGYYIMRLLGGSYNMTAGPLLPGYPTSATANGVNVTVNMTTTQNFQLNPVPYLVESSAAVTDPGPGGNGNGYFEPGETVNLWNSLLNSGAITATNVTGVLTSTTTGVTIVTPNASYPNIAAGQVATNTTAFRVSLAPNVTCGSVLDFSETATATQGTYTATFSLIAGEPLARADVLTNTVENGANGWTTGGTANTWAITTEAAHSPTHSWTDSPGAPYINNTNSWLRSPAFDLSGKTGVRVSLWTTYTLETGYDYVYVEYSTNGGTTWASTPLATFNGIQLAWRQFDVDAGVLDNQANVAIRFRMFSDGGVVYDGIHLDDVVVSYQPYQCTPLPPTYTVLLPVDFYNTP